MRSINARIVHWGVRYIIHRPPSHERVREWTAKIPLSYQANSQEVRDFITEFRTLE